MSSIIDNGSGVSAIGEGRIIDTDSGVDACSLLRLETDEGALKYLIGYSSDHSLFPSELALKNGHGDISIFAGGTSDSTALFKGNGDLEIAGDLKVSGEKVNSYTTASGVSGWNVHSTLTRSEYTRDITNLVTLEFTFKINSGSFGTGSNKLGTLLPGYRPRVLIEKQIRNSAGEVGFIRIEPDGDVWFEEIYVNTRSYYHFDWTYRIY